MNNYRKIFGVEIFHSYYENNLCTGLTYQPDEATKYLMKRFSLVLKLTNKGFNLYTDIKSNLVDFLNYLDKIVEKKVFTFNATTLNKRFYQFTKLPVNKLGVITYNSNTSVEVSDTNQLLLQSYFKEASLENLVFSLSVNFSDIIELENNNKEATYSIQFESRSTQWNYYIINKSGQSFGELSIEETKEINFEGPEEVTLENGQKAQMFSSGPQLLQLTEIPNYSFNLTSRTQRNGTYRSKIILKGLPNPNPSVFTIKPEKSTMISLMYVYV